MENSKFFRKIFFLRIFTVPLAIIFAFVLIPSFLLFLSPFCLYRFIVTLLARSFKRNSLSKILYCFSAGLASIEDISKMQKNTVTIGLCLEGKPDIDKLRQTFKNINQLKENGELIYPEMHQSISFFMGYPFWTKLENVDYSELIHFHKNDETLETNQKIVEDALIKEYWYKPYPNNKPIWEIIIFPNYTPHPEKPFPGQSKDSPYFVLLLKFHHSLMDGIAAAKYLHNSRFNKQDEKTSGNIAAKKLNVSYPVSTLLINLCKFPLEAVELGLSILCQQLFLQGWEKVLRNGQKDRSPVIVMSNTCPFKLQDLQDAKANYPGISSSAILYTAVAEAVRAELFQSKDNIPKDMRTTVMLQLPGHSGKLINHATICTFLLPLVEMDRVERLVEIQRRFDGFKKSSIPLITALLAIPITCLPKWILLPAGKCTLVNNSLDVLLTTSSTVELTAVCDHLVKDVFPGAGGIVGLTSPLLMLNSYNGNMKISLLVDQKVIKSQEMAEHFTNRIYREIQNFKLRLTPN